MEQKPALFFRSKEQELEHLCEFREVFRAYQENVKNENKKIKEKKEEIADCHDKIDYYSNPKRYYGSKTDWLDTLRAVCKAAIYVIAVIMFFTYMGSMVYVGAVAGLDFADLDFTGFQLAELVEVLLPILLTLAVSLIEFVLLAVSIFVTIFFAKKNRINRKFKRDKSTREVNIQSLNETIAKLKEEIKEFENEIERLTEEFYSVPTILYIGDYEYVEYIIYLYEAGRADNLKQAVVILDQEKRNLELLNKMVHMESVIDSAVRSMSNRLSGAISSMSNKLSAELQQSRADMNRQMTAMNVQQAASNMLAAKQLSQLRGINSNTGAIVNKLHEGVGVYKSL